MKHNFAIAAAIGIAMLTSCKKEATVDSQSQGQEGNVVYELVRDDDNDGGRTLSHLAFTAGEATISAIKFDARGDDRLEYSSRTVRTVNLFDAVNTIGALTIPEGTYRKIKAKIKFESANNHPALQLSGTYLPSSGLPVPITLTIDRPFEAKFDIKEPVVIDNNTNLSLLSSIPLGKIDDVLTDNLLNNATRDGNGNIIISSTSNTNLYNKLWDIMEDMLHVKVKKNR